MLTWITHIEFWIGQFDLQHLDIYEDFRSLMIIFEDDVLMDFQDIGMDG
jgi:hypothetical protein